MPKPRNSAAPLFRLPELYRLLAVLMVGLALVLGTAAKTAIEIGTTVKVVNLVRAKILNRRLKLGDNVVYQETVSTGKASAVDILLIDESTLIMGELSEMILDSMVYNPNRGVVEGTITVVKGIFRFSTAGVKMDVTINTPVASIGVRGTEFDVLTKPTETEIAVHEGTIEVTSAAGTQRVSRGQVYSVNAQGVGEFKAEPSPEMKESTALMLTLVANQGSQEAATQARQQPQSRAQPESQSQAQIQTAALPPSASLAFQKAVAGKNKENLLYMDLAGGRLVIELRPDLAPRHVSRIKELARQGFYDGLNFHFVRRGYVAETGDPTGTGTGGSGLTLKAEFSDVPFERGTVGMSREKDDPDSADSQFFIALDRAANLDGKYTVIGKVIHGLELADSLNTGRPPKTPDKIVQFRVGADAK
ncbi:MAG: peptidylprolyl isomerase [Proteobacteria bacterium]|nr:peptidylprolyl isomerase [Pseudomonadota bacterium]